MTFVSLIFLQVVVLSRNETGNVTLTFGGATITAEFPPYSSNTTITIRQVSAYDPRTYPKACPFTYFRLC